MLATGSKPWRFQPVAGFTLLEMLVSFALAGLLMAVVPLAFNKLADSFHYRSTVREIIADLRAARSQAMASGEDVAYEIDLDARTLKRGGGRSRQLPSSLDMDAIVGETTSLSQQRGVIRFYPDGSSTGGSILIVRKSSREGLRLRVDWLLGQVSQHPIGAQDG